MKKYKIILQYSFLLIILIGIFLFRIFFFQSRYHGNETYITGKLLSYQMDGNQLQLEVNGKEKILVYYYFQTEQEKDNFKDIYHLGDILTIVGKLKIPSSNRNFHLFHYQHYLKSKKINWIMDGETILLKKTNINFIYTIKNLFYQLLNQKENSKYFYYLLLGDSSYMNSNFIEKIRTLGISHLFAISGMHVHLLANVLLWIIGKIVKNKKIQWVILTLFLSFYMFLTNFSPSIVRASIFFLLLFLKKIFHWKIPSITVLFCIFIVMLLYNPYYIYHLGFVFSFTISFSLLYLSRFQRKQSYIKQLWQTSWISFWVGFPILIHSFFTVNFLAPIFNLFFVPFVSFILFPLCFISVFIPYLQPVFSLCQLILEKSVDLACYITIFQVSFSDFPVILLPVILLLIVYLLKCWLQKHRMPFILFILFILFYYYIAHFNSNFSVTFLDVGQGDSTLIVFPYQQGNVLIDTGGILPYKQDAWKKKKDYSIAESTLIPYLKSIGIHHLDYLILTHGDYDHMGEAIHLVNHFKVDKVIFNCGKFNDIEKELIYVLDDKNIPYEQCLETFSIATNKFYFLNTKEYDNENDNSSVIYVKLDRYQFLFMGDAEAEKEQDILEKYDLKNIDILKVGHHGSNTSSNKEFINRIHPKYSIISVGKNNRYNHPNQEVLKRLEKSKIYRTDLYGSILFQIKNHKLNIKYCIS